ncbi:5828_t:CDS:2 [Acaulospora colombiana]|uniref:5828_t:CDS:1 n=1 Tax=Acaulospora colombiana TaxID=27376 RepID=A0ACA9M7N6_9GLOM|nr:5828_t:CDS:2 [Acaulospora colombiana]
MSSILERTQKLVDIIQQQAHVCDVETIRKKLLRIIEDGLTNLHIICDFDGTITRHFNSKGERNPASHTLLSRSSRFTREYKIEVQKRFDHYYPIEMSTTMTKEEKTPYMVEWWNQAHELLVGQKINKDDIKGMVAETEVEMRPGLDALINKCKDKNIPFLVFSAGLGDVIEQVLISKNLFHPDNMHIVSNQMGFNEETGICDHFKEPMIHVFNKSEVMIKDTPYYTTIKNRGNVILLGDSIGDLQMAAGIHHDTCLAIGFLNSAISENLDTYSKVFDIVVLGDGPMDVANLIIKSSNGYA